MHLEDVRHEIIEQLLGASPHDDDALALVVVLHTHRIRTVNGTLEALTQRGAAAAVADAWPDRSDTERTNYVHWYWRFNTETPFETLADVTEAWRPRIEATRERLAAAATVVAVDGAD